MITVYPICETPVKFQCQDHSLTQHKCTFCSYRKKPFNYLTPLSILYNTHAAKTRTFTPWCVAVLSTYATTRTSVKWKLENLAALTLSVGVTVTFLLMRYKISQKNLEWFGSPNFGERLTILTIYLL